MWIRALISVKMDRPIKPGEHYISPGGYSIRAGEKIIDFDFEDYEGTVDASDPSVLHCELKNFVIDGGDPGNAEFIKNVLPKAESIEDCFVYTGEPGEDPEISVEKLLSFAIISEYDDDFAAKPTEWLDIKIYPDEMQFRFTDKAIGDYNGRLKGDKA